MHILRSLLPHLRRGVPTLRELSLAGNDIADIGMVALAGALFGTDSLSQAAQESNEAAGEEGDQEGTEAAGDSPTVADAGSADDAAAEPTGGENGEEGAGSGAAGGGEGGAGEATLPLLESLSLADNRISNGGLESVDRALQADNALANVPALRNFDVRNQAGGPHGAGSGREC